MSSSYIIPYVPRKYFRISCHCPVSTQSPDKQTSNPFCVHLFYCCIAIESALQDFAWFASPPSRYPSSPLFPCLHRNARSPLLASRIAAALTKAPALSPAVHTQQIVRPRLNQSLGSQPEHPPTIYYLSGHGR